MAEEAILPNNKVTVGFEHTVIRGEYGDGKSVASIYVQVDVPPASDNPEADDEAWLVAVNDAWARAKASVFKQLGVPAKLEDGIVMAVIQENFPGAVTESGALPPTSAGAPVDAVGPTPPHSKDEVNAASPDMKKAMRRENATWAKARYATHPREFWDNRAKNAENGTNYPDFNHKDSGAGFYAD